MADTAAGWYEDPTTAGQKRWWDGALWTEHVAPILPGDVHGPDADGALAVADAVVAPVDAAAPAPSTTPWGAPAAPAPAATSEPPGGTYVPPQPGAAPAAGSWQDDILKSADRYEPEPSRSRRKVRRKLS